MSFPLEVRHDMAIVSGNHQHRGGSTKARTLSRTGRLPAAEKETCTQLPLPLSAQHTQEFNTSRKIRHMDHRQPNSQHQKVICVFRDKSHVAQE